MADRRQIADRRQQALQLRVAGVPFDAIARQLGCSVATARLDVAKALNASSAAPEVELEMERLEAMERATWQVLRRPRQVPDDQTALQAVDTLLRIHEQRTRTQLFGDAIEMAREAREEGLVAEDEETGGAGG